MNIAPLQSLEQKIIGCTRCPRLTAYRKQASQHKRKAYLAETYWGKPVPGWGDPGARLLILGLAPGTHGANRTGRVFLGDSSGNFLFKALHQAGFSSHPTVNIETSKLVLRDTFLSNVVRCVPPQNRPSSAELAACRSYLQQEIQLLPHLKCLLTLGKTAYDSTLRALQALDFSLPRPKPKFSHGQQVSLPPYTILASYHPSQRNTHTGLLTPEMFTEIISAGKQLIQEKHNHGI